MCFVSPYIKRVTRTAVFSVTLCLPREVLLQCDDCHRRLFDTRQDGVKVFANERRVTVIHFSLYCLYTWPSYLVSTSLRHRDFVTFKESKTILKFYRTWTLSTHSLVSYNNIYYIKEWGTRWRSWLRHCATNEKVTGSISVGVIFHWHNPSGRTLALVLTQPLTEVSTRNISWG